MSDLRKAAQQALEALEQANEAVAGWGSYASEYFQKKHDLQGDLGAIQAQVTALSAALAEPQRPLLTDAEIEAMAESCEGGYLFSYLRFARAIERKLRGEE